MQENHAERNYIIEPLKMARLCVSSESCSEKFCKFHRKTPAINKILLHCKCILVNVFLRDTFRVTGSKSLHMYDLGYEASWESHVDLPFKLFQKRSCKKQ